MKRVLVEFDRYKTRESKRYQVMVPVRIKRYSDPCYTVVCEEPINLGFNSGLRHFRLYPNYSVEFKSPLDGYYYPFYNDQPRWKFNYLIQIKQAVYVWLLVARKLKLPKDVARLIGKLVRHDNVYNEWNL